MNTFFKKGENEMKRIGMGLVGPGFIAAHHVDAVRRLGDVDVVAIAGSSNASAQRAADKLHVGRAYGDYRELIADPAVEVVHNTTPNYLHLPVSLAALEAGKHVISDKPLAMTPAECVRLRDAAAAAGVANVVTFNYRGNPLVQQARVMIAREELGPLVFVHGQYLQDWMTDATVYSWRMDTARGGASSALADVGSHWCDLAEHVSGLRITEVLADLTTAVETRYEQASAEAFSVAPRKEGGRPVKMEGEDIASVLLRFSNGARGSLRVGQVLPGHKNDLQLELNGRKASLRWLQEEQNELWIGRHDAPNQLMAKDPSLLLDEARAYAHLPGGHQESWADAFRNVIDDAYHWIRAGADPAAKRATVCTFADGLRTSRVVDAMLRSHAAGGRWQSIEGDTNSAPSLSQQEAQPVTP